MCYIRGTCYVSILRTCHSEVDRGIKICSGTVGVFSVSRVLLRLKLPASFKVHLKQRFLQALGRHRRKSIGVIHTYSSPTSIIPAPKISIPLHHTTETVSHTQQSSAASFRCNANKRNLATYDQFLLHWTDLVLFALLFRTY